MDGEIKSGWIIGRPEIGFTWSRLVLQPASVAVGATFYPHTSRGIIFRFFCLGVKNMWRDEAPRTVPDEQQRVTTVFVFSFLLLSFCRLLRFLEKFRLNKYKFSRQFERFGAQLLQLVALSDCALWWGNLCVAWKMVVFHLSLSCIRTICRFKGNMKDTCTELLRS